MRKSRIVSHTHFPKALQLHEPNHTTHELSPMFGLGRAYRAAGAGARGAGVCMGGHVGRRRCKNPSGTSSGALGRRDFVRPEFIAMLNDAGGPCWSYESRAGL